MAPRVEIYSIFVDGRHVGGRDDLRELDRNGQLDALPGPVAAKE